MGIISKILGKGRREDLAAAEFDFLGLIDAKLTSKLGAGQKSAIEQRALQAFEANFRLNYVKMKTLIELHIQDIEQKESAVNAERRKEINAGAITPEQLAQSPREDLKIATAFTRFIRDLDEGFIA